MFFYIDPGTGSMLFTILIGVLGALIYALRNSWMKLKVLFLGGRSREKSSSGTPFVFFTDSKRYWTIFKPLCDEMEKRGETVLYLTASPDDPLLEEKYTHIKTEFIGEGNRAYARMNMLQADVVLSSNPFAVSILISMLSSSFKIFSPSDQTAIPAFPACSAT